MASLKKESAKHRFDSVNAFILNIIEQNIGHIQPVNRPTYHDLDNLAGTWTEKDEKAFKKNAGYFEKIEELPALVGAPVRREISGN
jgi:hypothetical protein